MDKKDKFLTAIGIIGLVIMAVVFFIVEFSK